MPTHDYHPYTQRDLGYFNSWRQWTNMIIKEAVFYYFRLFHGLRVSGEEHIPRDSNQFIFVANHVSNWDPFVLGGCIHRWNVVFMAKKELYETKGSAEFMDLCGTFAVNRDKLDVSTIRTAKIVPKTNHWILAIFPEGTRQTQDGDEQQLGETKKGAGFLAKLLQLDVLPAYISHDAKGQCQVTFGPLIKNQGEPVETLNEYIETALTGMAEGPTLSSSV